MWIVARKLSEGRSQLLGAQSSQGHGDGVFRGSWHKRHLMSSVHCCTRGRSAWHSTTRKLALKMYSHVRLGRVGHVCSLDFGLNCIFTALEERMMHASPSPAHTIPEPCVCLSSLFPFTMRKVRARTILVPNRHPLFGLGSRLGTIMHDLGASENGVRPGVGRPWACCSGAREATEAVHTRHGTHATGHAARGLAFGRRPRHDGDSRWEMVSGSCPFEEFRAPGS